MKKDATLNEIPVFVITGKNLTGVDIELLSRETRAFFPQEHSLEEGVAGPSPQGCSRGKVNQDEGEGVAEGCPKNARPRSFLRGSTMEETKNILIAEDDPASRELLLEILDLMGYEVIAACDGAGAL